jgi:transposase InsO family protein
VRAAAPNEIWHVDVTVLKLIDGTKAYLHAIIDNYSRKTLAWTVAERLNPTANCQLLLAAAKHMVFAGRPLLFADSGIDNINSAVDDALFKCRIRHSVAKPRTRCTSARRSTCRRNWRRPGTGHGRSALL